MLVGAEIPLGAVPLNKGLAGGPFGIQTETVFSTQEFIKGEVIFGARRRI